MYHIFQRFEMTKYNTIMCIAAFRFKQITSNIYFACTILTKHLFWTHEKGFKCYICTERFVLVSRGPQRCMLYRIHTSNAIWEKHYHDMVRLGNLDNRVFLEEFVMIWLLSVCKPLTHWNKRGIRYFHINYKAFATYVCCATLREILIARYWWYNTFFDIQFKFLHIPIYVCQFVRNPMKMCQFQFFKWNIPKENQNILFAENSSC